MVEPPTKVAAAGGKVPFRVAPFGAGRGKQVGSLMGNPRCQGAKGPQEV